MANRKDNAMHHSCAHYPHKKGGNGLHCSWSKFQPYLLYTAPWFVWLSGAGANAANKILAILCNNHLHYHGSLSSFFFVRTKVPYFVACKWWQPYFSHNSRGAILMFNAKSALAGDQNRSAMEVASTNEYRAANRRAEHKTQFLILILLHFF